MNKKHNIITIFYIFICLVLTLFFPKTSTVIFLSNLIYIIKEIFKYKLIDYRVGLLSFSSFYFLGSYINYFFLKKTHFSSGPIGEVMSDPNINIESLAFVVLFQLGVILHYELVNFNISSLINRTKKPFFSKDNFLLLKYGIPIVLVIFFIELSLLDWKRISQEYTLEAISRVFYFFYVLFALLAAKFTYDRHYLKKQPISVYLVIILMLPIINYMGVRQIIVWGALTIIICSYTYFYIYNNINHTIIYKFLKSLKYFIISFSFLMVISFGFLFRHRKTEMFTVLNNMTFSDLINAVVMGISAETTFTSYNLLSVVDQINKGNSMFFLQNFTDFFVLFLPTFIFPQKYNYIHFFNYARDYNVTPFGSWYIVGEFVASFYYPVLVFFGSFLYCYIIFLFIKYLFLKCKTVLTSCLFYSITYIFSSLYVVRGTVEGGIKVGLTVIIGILLIKYFLNMINSILLYKTSKV